MKEKNTERQLLFFLVIAAPLKNGGGDLDIVFVGFLAMTTVDATNKND